MDWNLPATHSWQYAALACVNAAWPIRPAAHVVHAVEPSASANVPAEHAVQPDVPAAPLYLPVGHVTHCPGTVLPQPERNRPAGQWWSQTLQPLLPGAGA
jgi:hypothetical protein